jgi:hypothetical protein
MRLEVKIHFERCNADHHENMQNNETNFQNEKNPWVSILFVSKDIMYWVQMIKISTYRDPPDL